MTLSIAGALRGTPTTAGSYSFTITASDASGDSGSLLYHLTVNSPPLAIQPGMVHAATEKTVFSQALSASGGSGSGYTFTAAGLPSWLHLSSGGVFSGKAPARSSAPVNFMVTLTDSSHDTTSASYSIAIDPPLKTGPKTLAQATDGKSYTARLKASGGSGGGYTFTAESLPSWLKLSPAGVLSGTPTAAGSVRISVIVTDSRDGTATISETIKVKAAKRHGGPKARVWF